MGRKRRYAAGIAFVQAVGVCAAAVIWQALVTDYILHRKLTVFLRPSCRWWVYPGTGSSVRKLAAGPFFLAGDFATLFAITVVLILPIFWLKPRRRPVTIVRMV